MLPVKRAYDALISDETLKNALNDARGEELEDQTIYMLAIPETFQNKKSAPVIRIESVNNYGSFYFDDEANAETVEIQVSTMANSMKHLEVLIPLIDEAMRSSGFEQYADKTYIEPDFKFKYNARQYKGVFVKKSREKE
ncbi:hypothetical protein JKT90_01640 [Listeria monocytogenes]|nr:hypothetical protein [Listeria monocytogenes]MCP6825353.1 hypothetical protein [Listeria monocytogenes]MCP6898452.1 hypothetical protein [Listeria monocytogenes]MCP6904697.1 hypothetical protein [Listeria monocytogenes]MCP6916233.1 hypothetical protein [Listeria monocytogenes]